ncbi:MAG: hypothetical protein Q8P84_07895 [Deltaproteobacteria bacterium]|nr:hypothetical protein [Deltaproteobacteria bacterium]
MILASILSLLAAKAEARDFFEWQDEVTRLAQTAIEKEDAKALHQLFLMSLDTDGAMVDTLGEAYFDIREKKPKFFRKVLGKENKKVRKAVEWNLIAGHGESAD